MDKQPPKLVRNHFEWDVFQQAFDAFGGEVVGVGDGQQPNTIQAATAEFEFLLHAPWCRFQYAKKCLG